MLLHMNHTSQLLPSCNKTSFMLNMKPCGYIDKYEWNMNIKLSRINVFDEELFEVEGER